MDESVYMGINIRPYVYSVSVSWNMYTYFSSVVLFKLWSAMQLLLLLLLLLLPV